MRLIDMMAKSCLYAQEHIADPEAWSTDPFDRETLLQCVSYQMACFLSQNTVNGREGVDWDVVINELVSSPTKTEKQWKLILDNVAKELGGWK